MVDFQGLSLGTHQKEGAVNLEVAKQRLSFVQIGRAVVLQLVLKLKESVPPPRANGADHTAAHSSSWSEVSVEGVRALTPRRNAYSEQSPTPPTRPKRERGC